MKRDAAQLGLESVPYVCVYINMYIYIFTSMHVRMHAWMYVRMHGSLLGMFNIRVWGYVQARWSGAYYPF